MPLDDEDLTAIEWYLSEMKDLIAEANREVTQMQKQKRPPHAPWRAFFMRRGARMDEVLGMMRVMLENKGN